MIEPAARRPASLRLRLAAIFLMGFGSGLPFALTSGTLVIWLADYGVSIKSIGLFALVRSAYSLKFLWSPLIDFVPAPLLTRWFGQRRGWILLTQAGLIIALLGLGRSDPKIGIVATAGWAVLVATLSATQDMAVDGLRVALLAPDEQGAGASATQMGYRLGLIVSGAGALYLSSLADWSLTYGVMSGLMLVGTLGCLLVAEPGGAGPAERAISPTRLLEPVLDLLRRNGALVALSLVPLYFLGDAIAGGLSGPFYLSLGFTKSEIATITKLLGVIASVGGVALGGLAVQRLGVGRALLLCGCAKLLTSLLYLVQLWAGHDLSALALTISAENLAGGAAGSAFVAYLSRLCRAQHSATQYALLSAFGTVGTNMIAASSGYLEASLGWAGFFLFSTGLAFPALFLLLIFGQKIAAAHTND